MDKKYLDDLAWRTSLDSGGYGWTDGAEYGLPGVAVTDGDIEYFIGSPHRGIKGYELFVFRESEGYGPAYSFPRVIKINTEMVYVRIGQGQAYAVDRECTWCTYDTETGEEREPQAECERCEGSGYIDCPGGGWAAYGLMEDNYPDIQNVLDYAQYEAAFKAGVEDLQDGTFSAGYWPGEAPDCECEEARLCECPIIDDCNCPRGDIDCTCYGDADTHIDFSSSACDICDRRLAGSRTAIIGWLTGAREAGYTVWDRWSGEACDDCVYYSAYGTLDDQTMIEVRESEEE